MPLSAVTGTDEYVSKLTVSKIVLMIIHEIVSSIKSKRSLVFNLKNSQGLKLVNWSTQEASGDRNVRDSLII